MRSANLLKRLEQILVSRSSIVQKRSRICSLYVAQREKQMFSRNEFVAKILCFFLGAIEHLVELARNIGLGVSLLRIPCRFLFCFLAKGRYAHAELLQNGNDNPFILSEQCEEEVKVINLRTASTASE